MEQFKDIEGYEGLYQVSKDGNVKSLPKYKASKSKILKSGDRSGYRFVYLYKDKKRKAFNIHRLVALTWLPNPSHKPHINHIDNNRTNNELLNLEWCTHSENMLHASKQGRIPKGKSNCLEYAKLKRDRALESAKAMLGEKYISHKKVATKDRYRTIIEFKCDCSEIVKARNDSILIKKGMCNSCSRKRR